MKLPSINSLSQSEDSLHLSVSVMPPLTARLPGNSVCVCVCMYCVCVCVYIYVCVNIEPVQPAKCVCVCVWSRFVCFYFEANGN